MILEAAILIAFPGLMVFAAFSDLLTMTIPNRVSIALALLFAGLAAACGLSLPQISWHLASGAVMLALGFSLFARGWIGGGDAKLAAATALWLGFDHLADYGLCAALLGGGLTLLVLVMRRWPLPSFLMNQAWIARIHDRDNGVPYGIALAVAGLILYPDTRIWLS